MIKNYNYKTVLKLIFFLLSLPTLSIADARNTETPSFLNGGKIISASEAKQLMDKEKVFLVDCRSAFNYGKKHIPKAKLISYQHTYKKTASGNKPSLKNIDISRLPASKDTLIIFYSHGVTGWKSYKAASAAIKAGYSNVHWLRGGLKEWTDAKYATEY